MRVFQVINVRWYNATAWYALHLSRLLAGAGHEVLVLVQPGTETEAKARSMGLDVAGVELNSAHPARFAAACALALALVREKRPQVVNCHRGEGFFFWCLLRALGGSFRLVRTRGDQRPPRADAVNRLLHGRVADAVVATNTRMARHFSEVMGLPADRLWTIRGGVDTKRFRFDPQGRERVRREFGFGPEDFVLGLLGRFDRVKGQKELIEAVARLRREPELRRVKLLLAGFPTATSREEVEGWIAGCGVGEAVAISGHRPDVPALISAMDLGVLASLGSETIARAALEIMACGVPLVSTDVGVMPDLVPAWALVPPGDPAALAEMIRRAESSGDFRKRLAQEQAGTMSQLSCGDFLRQTLSLYQGLLEEGRAGA